jgi:hypothetical protein
MWFTGAIKAARRALLASAMAVALAISIAGGAPAAHAGTRGCSWQPLTLEGGWQSEQGTYKSGDPSYCADSDGTVYLSGSLYRPAGDSFSPFAALPSYAAPAHAELMSVYTSNGTPGVLEIDANGWLRAYDGNASEFTSLAGVSFPSASVSEVGVMPLLNGWQSGNSWGTGDPSYYISNGAVHLDGSVLNPTPHVPWTKDGEFMQLPAGAQPANWPVIFGCFEKPVYTAGGGTGLMWNDTSNGTFYAPSTDFTSLAGVSYPLPSTTWQPVTSTAAPCMGLAYAIISGVVYLTGWLQLSPGFFGQIGVLPAGARPAHVLYLIVGGNGTGGTQWVTMRIDPSGAVGIYNGGGDSSGFYVNPTGTAYHTNS